MSEIEGLNTDEPLAKRTDRHAFDRLIMLSDGVFAIAVTLAALDVRPEGGWYDLPSLWHALSHAIASYGVSFAVISACWLAHRDTFARLKRVDPSLTILTLILLFVVSILPSTTRLLYQPGAAVGASIQLYGLSLAALSIIQAVMWGYAAFAPNLMMDEVPTRYRWTRTVTSVAVIPIFLAIGLLGEKRVTSTTGLALIAGSALAIAVSRRRFATGR